MSLNRLVVSLSLSLASAAMAQVDPLRPYSGQRVVRATVSTPQQLLRVSSVAESIWSHRVGIGEIDVQLAPGKTELLDELKVPYVVLIPDLQVLVDQEAAQIAAAGLARDDAWFTTYRTLTEIYTKLTDLAAAQPGVASVSTIGNSLEGRAIRMIRISGPDQPGNPRSSRPQVMFNGCQHAREWVSPMTVMYIAEQLVSQYSSDAQVHALLDSAEILIVPVVNPDGYEFTWTNGNRFWRKNRRNNGDGTFGIDLNRNFSVGWGGNDGSSPSTGSETYRGPSAFSEPETRVVRDMMLAEARVRGSIDFHSYSQLILSPYGYTTQLPPDAADFDRLNLIVQNAVQGVHGFPYAAGPTATTIYIASGTASDYSYGQFGAYGYGVELRDQGQFGFALPADQIIPTAQENWALAKAFAQYSVAPVRFSFVTAQPTTVPADASTTLDIRVEAARGGILDTNSPVVHWTVSPGSNAGMAPMVSMGSGVYRATLPAMACGRNVSYFFTASDSTGHAGSFPEGAPAQSFAASAVQTTVVLDDHCEALGGWSLSIASDNATTGRWENAVPFATQAQPGQDHSVAGTRCFVTDGRAGASIGQYDIDNGTTTLTSPTFSAVPGPGVIGDAYVSYWLWYANNPTGSQSTNTLVANISNDDGATWQSLEVVTQSTGAWAFREFAVASVITPTATMKVRFIARDLTATIIEAGVDDFLVRMGGCPPDPADFDGDGTVDFFDYDAFVVCFEGGACPPGKTADFDGDGSVDFFDYDAFVRAFEGG
ncbi:MAG: M14 family metallopeptidase [Planctomycetota bacterium]